MAKPLYLSLVASFAIIIAAGQNTGFATSVTTIDGDYIVETRPLLVTSSNGPAGGDRIAVPGNPATSEGIDTDGVGRLFIDTNPMAGFGSLCSGSLLKVGGGRYLLTAAHCVTDNAGNINVIDGGDGNSVTFQTGAGNFIYNFTSADVSVHPMYNGDTTDGFDLAVINLNAVVDPAATRYDLNLNMAIEGNQHFKVGYGTSGFGATGVTIGGGTKRSGQNRYESLGLPLGSVNNPETQLVTDFDSGSAANDAFPFFGFGAADLGFGEDEVGVAPGDSGGPTFIFDGGVPKIAGVHSYGQRVAFAGGATSDVDGAINSSWGEFNGDARIAEPRMFGFIYSVIPEPSSFLLLAGGTLAIAVRRRTRS